VNLALEIVGGAFIVLGVLCVLLGLFGVLRFDTFGMRLLTSSKIDTVAMLSILLGVMIRNGFSWLSAKSMLIFVIVLIVNPLVTAKVASSEHLDALSAQAAKQQAHNALTGSQASPPPPTALRMHTSEFHTPGRKDQAKDPGGMTAANGARPGSGE